MLSCTWPPNCNLEEDDPCARVIDLAQLQDMKDEEVVMMLRLV